QAFADNLQPNEALVLAHHAEDQAETFLLQALRGSGVAGLAAMPRVADFGQALLWRPFLAQPRQDLQAYAQQVGLSWVDDPSNQDTAYDRNYLRHEVWDKITTRWPAASRTLARAAFWSAQAHEAFSELAYADT